VGQYEPNDKAQIPDKKISVLVSTESQFLACLTEGISRIYAEASCFTHKDIDCLAEKAHEHGIKLFVALSRVDIDDRLAMNRSDLESRKFDGYLIRTFGQLYLLAASKKEKILDYGFNVLNSLSFYYMLKFADGVTLSPELTLDEINTLSGGENAEVIIHGRQTLMITRQCPVGLYAAEKDNERFCKFKGSSNGYMIMDDKGAKFPVFTDCTECVSYILNSSTLYMLNKISDVAKLNAGCLRLEFTTEDGDEAKLLTECYMKALDGNNIDIISYVIGRYESIGIGNTGHFYKGIF
jgi:putative protease